MRIHRLLLVSCSVSILGACSPYLYQKEIQLLDKRGDEFGAAVKQAPVTNADDFRQVQIVDQQRAQAAPRDARVVRLHHTGLTKY
jgi:hypothetical protein